MSRRPRISYRKFTGGVHIPEQNIGQRIPGLLTGIPQIKYSIRFIRNRRNIERPPMHQTNDNRLSKTIQGFEKFILLAP